MNLEQRSASSELHPLARSQSCSVMNFLTLHCCIVLSSVELQLLLVIRAIFCIQGSIREEPVDSDELYPTIRLNFARWIQET
jgi:hypothetical protein